MSTVTHAAFSDEFGYVVMSLAGIALQILATGIPIGSARKRLFGKDGPAQKNKEYAALKDEHKKAFGGDVPQEGYPDMGSGRFTALLEYKDWYTFNCAQRAHQNYVEQAASIVILVLMLGLYAPVLAAQTALVYIVGREFYSYGYRNRGPAGRLIGAIMLDLALVFAFGACMYYGGSQVGFVQKVAAFFG